MKDGQNVFLICHYLIGMIYLIKGYLNNNIISSFFPASKGEKGEMVGKTRGKRVFL